MSRSQRREATNRPAARSEHAVMWRGKRFTLPSASEFPLAAIEAEEEGKVLLSLRLILGDEQYTTWRGLATTAADAEHFSQTIMRELGRGNP
ncbi:hypothetical protein FHX81_5646 [Saccharothrix saharensis]|uniref:Uncharacterized protein n=1 Tax=Saccharothrix saharensis TaxID=571190 RepID=A0A543JKF7_9PSEU|nr:hypothetical protein [Saccharothrix saharensis]TQM83228.1 hypothetical protein FHX81_5646 [Saccharothrix saharensis]